jgi:hypothetical protein
LDAAAFQTVGSSLQFPDAIHHYIVRGPMRALRAGALAVLLLAVACAPRTASLPAGQTSADSIARLELAGEFNIPPGSRFDALKAARFGGVSGLAMDPVHGDLLGVCDDRDNPRVFVFQVEVPGAGAPFRVNLHAYFPLPSGPGAPAALDPEGIAITRTGRLFVSSEGIGNEEPRVPPSVLEYRRNYSFSGALEVPPKFIPPPTGPPTRGVRENAAFESLTITPDDQRLYTGTETALVQDGEPATFDHGATARILEYVANGPAYTPAREFAYPIEPLARPVFTPRFFVTGLVELLALGGDEFLAMERGYAEEGGANGGRLNQIRIFRISIAGATDISAMYSLRGRRGIVPVRKTLVLDLSKVKGLSPELASLDNFEGMTFGPRLPDGSRTLLLVSDDNFNEKQRTSFLLFRVLGS